MIIVAHGSRSPRWVAAQRDWFDGVRRELGPLGGQVELTFLEISLPLFEDRLLALAGQITEPLAIMPFFLSKGGHAGEDIPQIANQVLGPDRWRLVAPTGWIEVLGTNANRRLRQCGADPGEPVIVSGYGSSHEDREWLELVAEVQSHSGDFSTGPRWDFAPSGHFQPDPSQPLRSALRGLSDEGLRRAAILPFYLAVSSYQETLIPEVVAEFSHLDVRFNPTSILPDPELEKWAARIITQALSESNK